MDIDITWALLGLPLAFALGWLASRFDLRQLRIDNRRSPKDYFKGLNHLLSERQDEAIDAFIEAVRKDPDTSELHFALGNLFRRRGEYDRAVRVHEHLLARGDLSKAERDRAQHALALDFLKAGILNRAEEALAKLDGTSYEQEARLSRLLVFERTRDWPQAQRIAEQLQSTQAKGADYSQRIAHHLCEQAQSAQPEQKLTLLQQAISVAPQAARPRMDLAQAQLAAGQAELALASWAACADHAPQSLPLFAQAWAKLAAEQAATQPVLERLQADYASSRSLDVLSAISSLQEQQANDAQKIKRELQLQHLHQEPSLVVAAALMKSADIPADVQRALDKAAAPLQRYRCASCGFEATRHFWQCPGCQAWDSYSSRRVEEL
jgi:lipopolysaccharide assembly protein B